MKHIKIANQSLTVSQMFASPPEGLGPREWFINLDELSRQIGRPVNGIVTEVEIGGTNKLVLLDDGPGMPPAATEGGDFDLTTFVSSIAASGAYKNVTVDGNQGRGFRLAWSAYSPMGIIVLSKVAGGETYRARWWKTAADEWVYEEPVLDTKPLVDLGEHGTAFIMLGHGPDHDTVEEPFDGADEMKKEGTTFAYLLTRRVDKPMATCRVEAEGMLVGTPGGNHASRKVSFFGRDTEASKVMNETCVDIVGTDITLEWRRHTGLRHADRKKVQFAGTSFSTFATIVFENEMFDWTEGQDWAVLADNIGDLSHVVEDVSVRIHLGDSWKNRIKQSFDRRKLEWRSGMRESHRKCDRRKGHGVTVVAVRSFEKELTNFICYPQWLKDEITKRKRDRDQSVFDKQRQRWLSKLAKYKLMLNPAGKGHNDGDGLIVPMPGLRGGNGPAPDDFFKSGARLEVEIKPVSKEHERKYPVLHTYNANDKVWTMTLSSGSPYVVEALDVAAAALTKDKHAKYVSLTEEQLLKARTAAESAAAITLSDHFLFVQMHRSKGLYTEEDVELLLQEQPASTAAMQHYFSWLEVIPAIVKSDYLSSVSEEAA